MAFMDNKQISIMKKYLLLLALPLLVACSINNDEPLDKFSSSYIPNVIGTWKITSISNVDNEASMGWNNWHECWGDIYLHFQSDGSCTTSYINASEEIIERQQQGLPEFPYVYSRYEVGENGIRCYKPEYQGIDLALFEWQYVSENKIIVILKNGMYCMLSSYSNPQLYMTWERQPFKN